LLVFLVVAALSLTAPLLLGGSVVMMVVGVGRRTGIDGAARGLLLLRISLALLLGLLVMVLLLLVLLLLLLVQLVKILHPLLGPLRLLVLRGKGQPLETALGTQTLSEGILLPMEK